MWTTAFGIRRPEVCRASFLPPAPHGNHLPSLRAGVGRITPDSVGFPILPVWGGLEKEVQSREVEHREDRGDDAQGGQLFYGDDVVRGAHDVDWLALVLVCVETITHSILTANNFCEKS